MTYNEADESITPSRARLVAEDVESRVSAVARSFPLVAQVQAVLPATGWAVRAGADWCYVVPDGYAFLRQGWKLHVSATPLSALLVLSRCAQVLVHLGYAFKFAPDLGRLLDLLRRESDRAGAGKFLTVYPPRDADVAALAEALHRVTTGLPGPQILSDRQYLPGSLVHLRYGVHLAEPVLSDDGELHHRLVAPDGTLVPDRREAWFTMPDWVDDPVPPEPDAGGDRLLLAGRYRVHAAIQHANKGGVYEGRDERDDGEVIIKQARAHVGATLTGLDSRTLLRAEADALDALHPLGLCPRRVDLFTAGDSLFLVEEKLAGRTLTEWVLHRITPGSELSDVLPLPDVLRLAGRIVDLLSAVHDAGLRVGDLVPNNLMVCDDGAVRCIDLEAAGPSGAPAAPIGTAGYLAPEFRTSAVEQLLPGVGGDLYALGAVLFFLSTGVDPVLLDGEPGGDQQGRLAGLLDAVGTGSDAARLLAPAIHGLTATDPASRWTLARTRALLATLLMPEPTPPAIAVPVRHAAPSPEALLDDLVEALADTAVAGTDRPPTSDPRTVYAGAAGVLAVLTRTRPRSAAVEALLRQIYAPAPAGPTVPGLYTGAAGVAWAGFDAARVRGEDPGPALDLARQVPTAWHVPDVCHGVAGAGLAFAYLWHSGAGDEFRTRVAGCADHLSRTALDSPFGVMWTIPADADTVLAGQSHYGFAHGVAGIGTFLLAAADVTGDRRHRDLAVRAGRTLAANVRGDDSTAWWYVDPTEQEAGGSPVSPAYWCSGASGVGTFLLRLWRATDDPQWIGLARRAARTVRMEVQSASACYCHGLAGNVDFLLDMADTLGEARYRGWAEELVAVTVATAVRRSGRWVVADDTRTAVTPGFATGTAGTAAVLHRLVHGGGRWWLADTPSVEPPADGRHGLRGNPPRQRLDVRR